MTCPTAQKGGSLPSTRVYNGRDCLPIEGALVTVNLKSGRIALVATAALTLSLTGCGGGGGGGGDASGTTNEVSGEVVVDGSSTVAPLTTAAGELFGEKSPGVNVSVATSGTGGGFKKFCAGETDISDASRTIKDEEIQLCKQGGVEYVEFTVANDALSVVVSKNNTFLKCMTIEQLKKLWEPAAEGTVTTWNQVDPAFPAEKIDLYGPGTDSGTFDYFTAEVNGKEGASRTDYNASEDDNVIVQGVSGSTGALGYFGFSYLEANADKLKAVDIDGGSGCVAPNAEDVANGSYTPLGRPLFIYVSKKALADKPQVAAFVDYYLANDADITKAAAFIALNDEQKASNDKVMAGLG